MPGLWVVSIAWRAHRVDEPFRTSEDQQRCNVAEEQDGDLTFVHGSESDSRRAVLKIEN